MVDNGVTRTDKIQYAGGASFCSFFNMPVRSITIASEKWKQCNSHLFQSDLANLCNVLELAYNIYILATWKIG